MTRRGTDRGSEETASSVLLTPIPGEVVRSGAPYLKEARSQAFPPQDTHALPPRPSRDRATWDSYAGPFTVGAAYPAGGPSR